jgi:hypothetical protein
MIKKLCLLVILITNVNIAISQMYPEDREKFVKEFQKAMTEYGRGEFLTFAKKELEPMLLESSSFPDSYFKKMVSTCNLLLEKRMKQYPEVYNYVFSVYSFVKGKQSNESYLAWHSSIDKLLDSRNVKKFEDFIEFSAGFFSERKLAVSSNYEWYYVGGTYSFEFDEKPFVKCKNGTLACRVQNKDDNTSKKQPFVDSIALFNTSGTYDPIFKSWVGQGGTMNWEKVGIPSSKTFGLLNNYEVSMKTSNFAADSVLLTTPYFAKPIMGKVTDRAFKINREEDKIFPQFISYEKRLTIKEIKPEVDYNGGFSLHGAAFVGLGTQDQPSRIIIYNAGKPFITASSIEFTIDEKKITSFNTGFKIVYNFKDSISHPGVSFSYDIEKGNIEFARTKTGLGQTPFEDSYHQIDIYAPKLTWKKESSDILITYEMGTSQEQRIARLESKNYFDAQLYDKMQGMEAVHPLVSISKYSYANDKVVLSEGEVSSALHKTVEQAKPMLLELSNYGFIIYDIENKKVTVTPKLLNFVKSKAGIMDYDNIVFISDCRPKELKGYSEEEIKKSVYLQKLLEEYRVKTEERRLLKNFGVISLSRLDIELKAVDYVKLSDAQNTIVFPARNEVVIKENRNFEFNGWVNAGKMEINTLLANFNYKDFKINLLKTDRSTYRVRPLQAADGDRAIGLKSYISGIVGELFIDHPSNKAGISKEITEYPIIRSSEKSFVYYNSKNTMRGLYDSTRFYYTVFPFEVDSLDNFTEKGFSIVGELTSAGIFPVIKQDLVIMPDYSLGFSTKAPAGGYDFYGTKAKYDNKIVLSNNGLQGSGEIKFVESTSESLAYTFLPDSTVGLARFVNKAVETGIEFPDVTCNEANVTYIPKGNVLKAASTPRNELIFFEKQCKMRGTIFIRPNGMRGKGEMDLTTANVHSFDYSYKRWVIDADTSNFNLKNNYQEEGEDPLSFKTENVNCHISFKDRKGDFKSNDGTSIVRFPNNLYICKMDMFTWMMDDEAIEISSQERKEDAASDLDLVGPNFYSVHPKQDSLQFNAPKAIFSLKEKTIYCSKVEYLDIADARIYPDSMKITIRKKAKMETLRNAKIVANYITKYHNFSEATLNIMARRDYSGTGKYPYYDKDSNLTYFVMDKIYLDSAYQTIGKGKIGNEDNFKLSKEFDYYGDVSIHASSPEILFKGATRINHECEKFERNWMAFTAKVDPKNIQIPVSKEMKNLEGQPIAAGILWRDSRALDSIKLYPTFLSSVVDAKDPIAMTASGVLQYNMDTKEFQIGSKEKLLNRSEKGNYLALHTESCSMHGEGQINLGMDFGDVEIDAVGIMNYNQASGKTDMNLTLRMNMALDKGVMEATAERINEIEGLKPMEFAPTTLEQAIVEWVDTKTADKIKSDFTIEGKVKKLPDALESTFVLSGIKLISLDDPKFNEKGLVTNVESAVLVSIYGKPVMKYLPMNLVFQQVYSGSGGDKFGIYYSVPGGNEYFYDYVMEKKEGTMRIITSDTAMDEAINGMKPDKRKKKNFAYEITTQRLNLAKFKRFFGGE